MAEIIEVLSVQGIGGHEERQLFTVDTTPGVFEVTVAQPTQTPNLRCSLVDAPGQQANMWFQPDDNILIISYGLFLPHSFTCGGNPIHMQLFWEDEDAAINVVDQFGEGGAICAPWENFEFPAGVFVAHPSPGKHVKYYMNVSDLTDWESELATRISMVNVPAALNEEDLRVTPVLRILHNLPLLPAVP